MKQKYLMSGLAFLFFQITSAFADFPTFNLPYAEGGTPQISGNTVIWNTMVGNTAGIRIYNLSTRSDVLISTPDSDGYAGIDNDTVVWASQNSVNGYRISTGQQFELPLSGGAKWWAKVSGNTVTWTDQRYGPHVYTNIWGYDIAARTEFPICRNPSTNQLVSGDYVVWMDARDYSNNSYNIYGFNVRTKTEFPICTAPRWQGDLAISHNIVTWTDTRDYLENIYGYNLLTQTEFKIVTQIGADQSATNGQYVVWTDMRNGNRSIYGYDISTAKEFPIYTGPGNQFWPSISGNTVVWLNGDTGQIYGTVIPEPATLLLLWLGGMLLRGGKIGV